MNVQERYTPIKKEEIDYKLTYQGYYWYSNKKQPNTLEDGIFTSADFDNIKDGQVIGFLIEAQLYHVASETSYQIKYLDGAYHIAKIDLKDIAGKEYDHKTYFAHRIEGYNQYLMIEAWAEEKDPFLAGMATLVPAWSAFAGFVK